VSEKRKPQDGSFTMEFNKNNFDFRVSTLPTIWGESIVIRILDKRSILKSINEIGITQKNLILLKKALLQPNGIFLVTGPTGSGKSTTLYAALNEINSIDKKIITVEDPVEYKLKGIQQVQVNPKIGLTFARVLRSILRQDPDIIMIGEIRDLETLEIAIKAAMTGHLVLSTLHTNDAVSAINRMIDMGADSFLVATALIGVEAQRLVKTICPYCRVPYKPADVYLEPIKNIIQKETIFYKGKGCEKCNMTGFSGRTLITEIFLNDEKLESMISRKKEKLDLLHYLNSKEYKTMFYDGLLKALKGITTLEEVFRVAKL
jgi:general secretion pathway protein E/type IV pilus assembly protein PilB